MFPKPNLNQDWRLVSDRLNFSDDLLTAENSIVSNPYQNYHYCWYQANKGRHQVQNCLKLAPIHTLAPLLLSLWASVRHKSCASHFSRVNQPLPSTEKTTSGSRRKRCWNGSSEVFLTFMWYKRTHQVNITNIKRSWTLIGPRNYQSLSKG